MIITLDKKIKLFTNRLWVLSRVKTNKRVKQSLIPAVSRKILMDVHNVLLCELLMLCVMADPAAEYRAGNSNKKILTALKMMNIVTSLYYPNLIKIIFR